MTIRADAHKPDFHRAAPPQLPVRVATTASVTISTALNNGDTIDGITLATGDRVLVKDQSTGSQNGIYVVGASPARAFDFEEGLAAYGAMILVVDGTVNAGKLFRCTNLSVPTIGVTALVFTEFSSGAIAVTDGTTTVNPATSISFDPADFDVTSPGGGVAAVAFIGSGGGGGGAPNNLPENYDPDIYPPAKNAVSDEFDDGSLDAAWTWTTAPTGTVDESVMPGYLYIDAHTSDNTRFLRRAYVPGATAFTIVSKISPASDFNPSNFRFGIATLDSGDAAIGEATLYNNGANTQATRRIFDNATGFTYGSALGTPIYLLLQRDASNVYTAWWSRDGLAWNFIATHTIATTVAKYGFEFVGSSGKRPQIAIDFIRVFDSATFIIGDELDNGSNGGDVLRTASGYGEVRVPGAAIMHELKTGSLWDSFDTTDTSDPMTGYTTLGSPAAHNINSFARSHYYLKAAAAASPSLDGIYRSWSPSDGDYVECWLTGHKTDIANYIAGLFIGEAGGAGKIMSLHVTMNYNAIWDSHVGVFKYTNRTTFSSEPFASTNLRDIPHEGGIGLRWARESSSAFRFYLSWDGNLWLPHSATIDPAFTVGIVGLFCDTNSASGSGAEAIFDWLNGIQGGS